LHGAALAWAERVGNAEMDLLIVNLHLLGAHQHDVSRLQDYCELAAATMGVPLPANYPVVRRGCLPHRHRGPRGRHHEARKKGDAWLADRIYSAVPPARSGSGRKSRSPRLRVSNVKCWLEARVRSQ